MPLTPAFIAQSRMKRVTFELSDELHKKLKLLCYTESVSIGHILRQCVSDFCVKHDDNREKQQRKFHGFVKKSSVKAYIIGLIRC